MARGLAWLALASLVACASPTSNRIADAERGAPEVRRILLAPPNLVVALRSEIQSGSAPVDREIAAYLESQGRELSRLGLIEGRKLWKQAVAEAKAAGAIERGAGIFVAKLAREREFDALVMPSLILVRIQMDASNASWDGVSRRMRAANAPADAVGREQSTLAKGVAFGGISAPAWVTSLHVLVFARDGRRVFEGRGGIEFVHEIDLIDEGRSFRYELRPNGSIFTDRALLREGVVRAFEPWMIPPDA